MERLFRKGNINGMIIPNKLKDIFSVKTVSSKNTRGCTRFICSYFWKTERVILICLPPKILFQKYLHGLIAEMNKPMFE